MCAFVSVSLLIYSSLCLCFHACVFERTCLHIPVFVSECLWMYLSMYLRLCFNVLSCEDCLDHKHPPQIDRRCYIAITYREYPLCKQSGWRKIRHCESCKISVFDQAGLIMAGQSIKYWDLMVAERMRMAHDTGLARPSTQRLGIVACWILAQVYTSVHALSITNYIMWWSMRYYTDLAYIWTLAKIVK